MSRKKELRQSKIRQILLEESRVRVIDLARRLGVTPETLRNDISEMEAQSLLIREHGYARIQNPMQETPLLFRNQENAETKKRVGIRALNEIQDGSVVFLDSGSTVLLGIPALQGKKSLTIVTNSLPLAQQCAAFNFDILFTGGMIYNAGLRAYGTFAIEIIDHVHIDLAIMGTDGFKDCEGFTSTNINELGFKRHVMNQTEKLIMVTDSSKFHDKAPFTFCKFREFDMLVTNEISQDDLNLVKDIKKIIQV